tara:strand:+ start:1528 stop:3684 length:2157 start_codon:yes stop_codon:yes gene_type:complete
MIKTVDQMEHHPDSEHLVKMLMERTENNNPEFFRIVIAYYFGVMSSMMRGKIETLDHGILPINLYACPLAVSGSGKGRSTGLIEDQLINQFRSNFLQETLPLMLEINAPKIALERARRRGTDPDEEEASIMSEDKSLGPFLFSFDEATKPAIRDIRHKLLLAEGGALNLQIDEIGLNLSSVAEALGPYLELYDVGNIKSKLTKNTADNKRKEEIVGRTPANLLMFGAPESILNGGATEDQFISFLETGYGRRLLFSYCDTHEHGVQLSPEETLNRSIASNNDPFMELFSDRLGDMADIGNAERMIKLTRPIALIFIEYRQQCQRRCQELATFESIQRAELTHRYFKAMKLAGAYAWIDNAPEISEANCYAAIKMAEESGDAFNRIMTRDRAHVRLAKHLVEMKRPVTHSDLVEDLPYYKGSIPHKAEMIQLAIAYGYQNNIIIKTDQQDRVEFLNAEALEETDLDKMLVSYSQHVAYQFIPKTGKFEDLHELTQAKGYHWAAHHYNEQHRCEDKAIPGFNMLVLDCDGDVQLTTAKLLLDGYKAMFYTTKSHTDAINRFRVILPMNFVLKLNAKEHKEFWNNVYDWLPFEVDHASSERARKWESFHGGTYEYMDGKLVDVLPFIPKTSKNEDFKASMVDFKGVEALERWYLRSNLSDNRNKMMFRYAMMLVDAGYDFDSIKDKALNLNDRTSDPLTKDEILSTIMSSVAKKIAVKDSA